jgi:type VI secretion system protein ImpK
VQAIEVSSTTRLSELAADAIACAVQLRRAPEPDPDALRAEIKKLFTELDAAAASAGKDPALVQAVRYALCAFVDEIVLSSSWNIRQDWASRPLQMEYFNDFTAGEEFYRRIDSLRGGDDPARREALEVYALILGLGFRGKYGGMAGLEELRALRARLHAELSGGKTQAQPLSPHWQVEESVPQLVRRVPAWVFATIAAAALLLLIVVLRLWLNADEDAFTGVG